MQKEPHRNSGKARTQTKLPLCKSHRELVGNRTALTERGVTVRWQVSWL